LRTDKGITSNCEALRVEQMNAAFPAKTMIRSLNTLVPQAKKTAGFYKQMPADDQAFSGWGPEVQILTENDLKRIEKQEVRENRYRKRNTR
jgi:hypothetical protein